MLRSASAGYEGIYYNHIMLFLRDHTRRVMNRQILLASQFHSFLFYFIQYRFHSPHTVRFPSLSVYMNADAIPLAMAITMKMTMRWNGSVLPHAAGRSKLDGMETDE